MPSGFTASEDRAGVHASDVAYDVGRVVQVPTHEPGDEYQHIVKVRIDPNDPNSAVWAPVQVAAIGDINMPVEGDLVRVAYEKPDRPIVVGPRYRVEDSQADLRLTKYGPGHRKITHEPTEAHLELFPDGTVELKPEIGKPLILGGGQQAVTLREDFTYQPDETFYKLEWDNVETRLLTQDQLDEYEIGNHEDVDKLPLWDENTWEWVIPKQESEWREPDPRGAQWTVEGNIRFEKIAAQTMCEIGLFIREKNDSPQQGQLVTSRTVHGSVDQSALTIPYSITERFPDESRLSLHVRSKTGGGVISGNPLTVDNAPQNIQSDEYGAVENWDKRFPRARQTFFSISQTG